METWKDIEGYEGLYQVSDKGNVYSARKDKKLKLVNKKDGYVQVSLAKEGKTKAYRVHRLVAKAFVSNPNNYPVIDHIDGNPKNNVKENIRWCTQKDNVNNPVRFSRASNSLTNNSLNSKVTYQYTLDGTLVGIYPSASEVERKLGFLQGNVSSCCRGLLNTYKGYKWSYEPL